MRFILRTAAVYEAFQVLFGFSAVRKIAIEQYLSVKPGDKIIDIGCGPGKILSYLPHGVDYHGFDVEEAYIDHARKTYGERGNFYCREFDDTVLSEFHDADLIMLNGVLHHLSDDIADQILKTARKALSPTGVLFTLDGCYQDGQNPIAKKLLDYDRGENVRSQSEYQDILTKAFSKIDVHYRDDLSLVPYSFLIMMARP